MEPGSGEQRRVERVVRMVVGEDHVGNVLDTDTMSGKRFEDRRRSRHQARIDDNDRFTVENEADG